MESLALKIHVPISYPESPGSLASGWSPEETLRLFYRGNPAVIKFQYLRVSPEDCPRAISLPESSGSLASGFSPGETLD